MNTQRTLSQKDRLVLQSYESVLEGLAEFFGSGFEFVLHSLEDLDCAAIKVVNGYHSGRKEGAPITDFALQLLREMQRSKDHRKGRIYFGRSKNGTPIRSATIPINGENSQIIGLLCINFYQDVPLYTLIEELFQTSGTKGDVLETFAANADELIEESISQARIQVEHDGTIPSTNRNKEIIAILYQKDIFNLKNAVPKVAERLGLSKNTVYLHLRNLQAESGADEAGR